MGGFVVGVKAVGGHGCQREVGNGEKVEVNCGNPACPDCLAREFVGKLQAVGVNVEEALLVHWPDQPGEVQDNLLTRERKGSFR